MKAQSDMDVPLIIAGPIVRRLTDTRLVLWLATAVLPEGRLQLQADQGQFEESYSLDSDCMESVQAGKRLWINLIDIVPGQPFPQDQAISYDLQLKDARGQTQTLATLLPHLLYESAKSPAFTVHSRVGNLLHGSCRKPHYPSEDSLVTADSLMQEVLRKGEKGPAMLVMSGDQIYADDVAGPMLHIIHQVIELLGLPDEKIAGTGLSGSEELYSSEFCFYQREHLLPSTRSDEAMWEQVFGGARKPIFTADGAHNHLITLSEVMAMYLLVWSPGLWQQLELQGAKIAPQFAARYDEELVHIKKFSEGLHQVQRLMAHLPVYMIFDDHDVTDDWNLTRGWEEAAYGHPFSRRIIGNALAGYWMFQGWGNDPEAFSEQILPATRTFFSQLDGKVQDNLIDCLLEHQGWQYTVPTVPKLVVLDTRTRRWRSESSSARPSGLMDWEALSEAQQELIGEESVLLVSPAPIFGVKLIEAIQRIFTFFGKALTVDAENWMAHPGSANVILNIFRHPKTPRHFVILSGDVHYSFVYDVMIRFRRGGPRIWQITCSGLKNEFPPTLLKWLDRINRALYGRWSPLNWFTKRRRMWIAPRGVIGDAGRQLMGHSGIGRIWLDESGQPNKIRVYTGTAGAIGFRTSNRVIRKAARQDS
ncbi:alkaline phosphatase D family protein [Marinobacterium jannaschii]|uniref:alkaline phosphatase D family protein n=1 Tax=Marinobacterium jannaschii TaxID=64970 RepID=UPI000AEAE7B1|nr:alkaline phosphatase D family protein [Marinobacterium jannaschii]